MGGLIGKNQQNKKEFVKANKIIGREMKCDTCRKVFSANTNISLFNNHIKNCFHINRERDRIENLLNELRETNQEMEHLEKNKQKKKDENKKIKIDKLSKVKNNDTKHTKNIVIDSSNMIFFSPEALFNRDFERNLNDLVFNSTDNEGFDGCDQSEINFESLKGLPFEDKLEFFRSFVKTLKVDWREGSCNLEIDREDYFRQSMMQFEKIDPFKELKINFKGEVSHDAGGLIREWYSIIFKHLLSAETSNKINYIVFYKFFYQKHIWNIELKKLRRYNKK